jgi:hypothetical protein
MTDPRPTPIAEGVVPWPDDVAREYAERGW